MSRSPPGFRFSKTDAAAIVVVVAATVALWPLLFEYSLLPAIVLGHFFLFCNIFRVSRRFELWWSLFFVLNVAGWILTNRFGWTVILLTQLPITIGVIVLAMRLPTYHGVGYQWICPQQLEQPNTIEKNL